MQTLVVHKQEVHAVQVCPCPVCRRHRQQHRSVGAAAGRVVGVSPATAYALGIINTRCPAGSLARQIRSGTPPQP